MTRLIHHALPNGYFFFMTNLFFGQNSTGLHHEVLKAQSGLYSLLAMLLASCSFWHFTSVSCLFMFQFHFNDHAVTQCESVCGFPFFVQDISITVTVEESVFLHAYHRALLGRPNIEDFSSIYPLKSTINSQPWPILFQPFPQENRWNVIRGELQVTLTSAFCAMQEKIPAKPCMQATCS